MSRICYFVCLGSFPVDTQLGHSGGETIWSRRLKLGKVHCVVGQLPAASSSIYKLAVLHRYYFYFYSWCLSSLSPNVLQWNLSKVVAHQGGLARGGLSSEVNWNWLVKTAPPKLSILAILVRQAGFSYKGSTVLSWVICCYAAFMHVIFMLIVLICNVVYILLPSWHCI